MKPPYENTPLATDYQSLQRRRAVMRAMQEQAMAPYTTQMVSGRAVPYGTGEGLTKLGTAAIAAFGQNRADKQERELQDQYMNKRSEGMDKVIKTLQGYQPQADLEIAGPPQYVKPDPNAAALGLVSNPYLNDPGTQGVAKALITAQAYKDRAGGTPYFTNEYGADSTLQTNARTGEQSVLPYPEGFTGRDKYDPTLQGNVAGAVEGAKQTQRDIHEPQRAGAVRQSEKNVDLSMNPEIAKQTDLAGREAEKVITQPKIESTIDAAGAKTEMLGGRIAKAKEQAGAWTTGFLGSMTDWIPGTPAHNLSNTLSTIKANIGFDKLQEMRNNSPTGGALGQVSEFENKLLQDVWGALAQSQSKAQFIENLDLVEKQTKESWKRINAAYEKDYGKPYESGTKKPDKKGTFDDAEKEKRYQEWKARQEGAQ